MDDTKIPQRKHDYQLEEIDGELLLHDPGSTSTLYLNETASLIWQACDGERTTAEIAGLLQQAFPETAEAIPEQVASTVQRFVAHGAIELA